MFLSAFGAKVSAQSSTVYTIKGVVTDEFGKPLSGVVVNSETGKNGTSTDIEGSYMLTVDDGSKDIVFSYLGYKDKKGGHRREGNNRCEIGTRRFEKR